MARKVVSAFDLVPSGGGRFDVKVDGMRIGLVIGGGRVWCAEAGRRVIGYFTSSQQAGQAIVADRRGQQDQYKGKS